MSRDVTEDTRTGDPDGEHVPLTKCVCGATWDGWNGPILSIYSDDPTECPTCHRRFYVNIRVEVMEAT